MRFEFDPMAGADEDEFLETKTRLVDELRPWALDRFGDTDGVRALWAGTFMQWKFNYGDGRLHDVSVADVAEFALEWCPRKVAAGPESAPEIVDGVSAFVEFMADTDRLVGGFGRAAELMVALDDLRDGVAGAMGDSSNFGMAKSLFAGDGSSGGPLAAVFEALQSGEVDGGDLQAFLDQQMGVFNSLSFEERKRLTDHAVRPPELQRVQLSFVHVPPTGEEIDEAAGRSRLVRMVDQLIDWLGPKGQQVTQTGAFRMADARHLVELLNTDDFANRSGFGKIQSSRQLPVLSWVADLAAEAGALVVGKTKMTANPEWPTLPIADRAERLVGSFFALGVLSGADGRIDVFNQLDELIDDGVPHWLVNVLPVGAKLELDSIVDFAIAAAGTHFSGVAAHWGVSIWDDIIRTRVHQLFNAMETVGLVEIHDRAERRDQYGLVDYEGGWFGGTALARWLVAPLAREVGYDFAELADLAGADAETMVGSFAMGDVDADTVRERWLEPHNGHDGHDSDDGHGGHDGHDRAARVAELVAVAAFSDHPAFRVAVFSLLTALVEPAEASIAVRQLLDSPGAGHAALYLLEHDLASSDEVGAFVSIGPLVDHLWLLQHDPDEMASMFAYTQERAIDDLLEDMWRHDSWATSDVLEALGKSTTDKRLAKNARRAAMKHRTWLANRRHNE